MRHAPAEALVPFDPIAGRLTRDEDGRVEIGYNGEGGALRRGCCSGTAIDYYSDFALTVDFKHIILAVYYNNHPGQLTAFQPSPSSCSGELRMHYKLHMTTKLAYFMFCT